MIDKFAIIIGAMKCGTTSLFSYLSQHPQISAATIKEPCFFSTDKQWERGLDWYQTLWNWEPGTHKIALEASTSYTRIPTYQNSPARIQEAAAAGHDFKFIYIVRDPIERIQSHFTYSDALGHPEAIVDISRGVHSDLLTTSMYAKQLDYYRKFFSDDSLLVIKFSDLKKNPQELLKRICAFLQIDESFEFQDITKTINKNAGRIKKDPMWDALRKAKIFDPIARALPSRYKQAIHSIYGKKVNGNRPLSNDLREFILNMLSHDMHRLKQEYGIDLVDDLGILSDS